MPLKEGQKVQVYLISWQKQQLDMLVKEATSGRNQEAAEKGEIDDGIGC